MLDKPFFGCGRSESDGVQKVTTLAWHQNKKKKNEESP
jgi:hypothetical protein